MTPGVMRLCPSFTSSLACRALANMCRACPEPIAAAIQSLVGETPNAVEWGAVSYTDLAEGKGPYAEEEYQASVAVRRQHGSVKLRLHVQCIEGCGVGTCILTCLADLPQQCSGVKLFDFCFDYVNDVLQTAEVDERTLGNVGAVLLGVRRDTADNAIILQLLWRLLCAPLLARPHSCEMPFGTEITFAGLGLVFTVLHGRLQGGAMRRGSFKPQLAEENELKVLSRFLTGPP